MLYGCETWSLNREEYRLRVLENRILRIFGPKKDEIGEQRRFNNEELHSLYRSPNMVRVIKSRKPGWACQVAGKEEGRTAFKILRRKTTEKRFLGRPRSRWEDNIGWILKK